MNVLPADGLPVISDPVVAECRDSDTGQCSFAYSRAATPELLRVEVSEVKGHMVIWSLCLYMYIYQYYSICFFRTKGLGMRLGMRPGIKIGVKVVEGACIHTML